MDRACGIAATLGIQITETTVAHKHSAFERALAAVELWKGWLGSTEFNESAIVACIIRDLHEFVSDNLLPMKTWEEILAMATKVPPEF